MAFVQFYVFLAVISSSLIIGQGYITTPEPVIIALPAKVPDPPQPSANLRSASNDVPSMAVVGPSSASLLSSSKPDVTPTLRSEPLATSSPVPDSKTTTEHTTTLKPVPTTTTSTTTAPTTTTPTTTAPTTTDAPTPEPKPTPAPGPLPPPKQGSWSFTDKSTNVTCILVQFAAQLNVTYPKNINSSTSLDFVVLNVPENATVADGSCNTTEQWLKLSWPETGDYSMLLLFTENSTTKNYALKSLNVSISPDILANSSVKNPVELWHGVEWQVPLQTSYRCAPATPLNMSAEITSVVARLTLSQLQAEAFRTAKNSDSFSAPRECGGGDLPDAVPIAVGCALGGLVVVVLVAYLEGPPPLRRARVSLHVKRDRSTSRSQM